MTVTASTDSRVYNGTNVSAANATVSGLLAGESLSGINQTYNTSHAGTGLVLTAGNATNVTGGTAGSLLSDYNISYVSNTTGVISQANVTVTASTDSRVYNGTNVSAANATVSGLLAGESLSGINQTYNTSHAGTGLVLTAGNATNVTGGTAGSLLSDYNISYVSNTTGVISRANVTVTASTDSRVYNGTNVSAANATVSGLLAGESLSGINQTYNTSNVGTGLILTAGNATGVIGGTAGSLLSDYNISYVSNVTGEITALPTPPIVVVPPTTASPTPAPLPAPSPTPAPVVKPTALDMGRIDTLSNDASEKGITGSSDRSSEFVKSDDATKQTVRQDLQMGNPLFKGAAPVTSANYECDKNSALKLPAGVQNLATQCGNKDNR